MKTTELALREMLLELALGAKVSDSKSGKDDKDMGTNHSGIVPVSPSMESPIQLSVQSPNIVDPEYVPANRVELSRSLSAIGEMVPDDGVEKFYSSVKELFKELTGEEIA